MLLHSNKAARRAEAKHEQQALAAKEARLQSMRDLHAEVVKAKFKPVTKEQYAAMVRHKYVYEQA